MNAIFNNVRATSCGYQPRTLEGKQPRVYCAPISIEGLEGLDDMFPTLPFTINCLLAPSSAEAEMRFISARNRFQLRCNSAKGVFVINSEYNGGIPHPSAVENPSGFDLAVSLLLLLPLVVRS